MVHVQLKVDIDNSFQLERLVRFLKWKSLQKQTRLEFIPNDIIIRCILSRLQRNDRIALSIALCNRDKKNLIQYEIYQQHVHDLFCDNLQKCISWVADRSFYVSSHNAVFIDWSCFSRTRPVAAAMIYWSKHAPHMRVDTNQNAVRVASRRSIRKRSKNVRLSVHECIPLGNVDIETMVFCKDYQLYNLNDAMMFVRHMPHTTWEVTAANIPFLL